MSTKAGFQESFVVRRQHLKVVALILAVAYTQRSSTKVRRECLRLVTFCSFFVLFLMDKPRRALKIRSWFTSDISVFQCGNNACEYVLLFFLSACRQKIVQDNEKDLVGSRTSPGL